MMLSTTSSTGIATSSTELTCPPLAAENTRPATAIMGASRPMRSIRVRKFCTFVMSEVLRVTRLAVPNLSISVAEKLCTFANTWLRSWAAKSVEINEAILTDKKLMMQENMVTAAMIAANVQMILSEPAETPLLIISAKKEGSSICPTADRRIKASRLTICFVLSLTFVKIVFMNDVSCPFLSHVKDPFVPQHDTPYSYCTVNPRYHFFTIR